MNYYFYSVEINMENRRIENATIFLMTENNITSYYRGNRTVGYGRTQNEAFQNANHLVPATIHGE